MLTNDPTFLIHSRIRAKRQRARPQYSSTYLASILSVNKAASLLLHRLDLISWVSLKQSNPLVDSHKLSAANLTNISSHLLYSFLDSTCSRLGRHGIALRLDKVPALIALLVHHDVLVRLL